MIRSPPPNDGPLPTATSIASSASVRAVELEGVGQRLEGAQLGQGGEVVAHLALGPGHPVGALVDDGVEPGGEHGDEVLSPAAGQVDRARRRPAITRSAAASGSLRGMSK